MKQRSPGLWLSKAWALIFEIDYLKMFCFFASLFCHIISSSSLKIVSFPITGYMFLKASIVFGQVQAGADLLGAGFRKGGILRGT